MAQIGAEFWLPPALRTGITRFGTATDTFDSTMRSNLSVGLPIDLLSYERDSLRVTRRRRFEEGDAQFLQLTRAWSMGVRDLFTRLPEPSW